MTHALAPWIRALASTSTAAVAGVTLPGLLAALAEEHGSRPALLGDGGAIDYAGLARRAAAVGGWAQAQGLAGRTVGLLQAGSTDYVATWLGLSGVGCTVALLNTNLPGPALLHCLASAGATALIAEPALLAGCALPHGIEVWDGAGEDTPAALTAPASHHALLIYTSGTTGMPKAAVVSHGRIVEWSYWFAGLTGAGPEDRMYDCLPLYHSVGGVIAVGAMLVAGGSVLIRSRFHASRFWADIAANGCTMAQYIGELCRYLLRTPPGPADRAHGLRLACGNGLGPDIWEAVQARFALPRILEFYAATEGGVSLYNVEGKPGAIGRVPAVLQGRMGVALVRSDPDTGEPVRDAAGHCVACGPDEPGEALGRMDAARRFDGYTDPAASAKKLLRDAFAPGDCWFRTGDLLRRDAAGYYYFVDRIGDTFRWKGENVSATEVTAALRAAPGVADAAVYGVRVPGHDGRAGMAALTFEGAPDWAGLRAHLTGTLPGYAHPLFVRVCQALDVTGTFKLAKAQLAAGGIEGDGVFVLTGGGYVPLDTALRATIESGNWR